MHEYTYEGGHNMRGYHIEIGYNGGGTDETEENRWKTLKTITRKIADNPQAIIKEARRLGAPESCDGGKQCCNLDTYADNYQDDFDTLGHPITIIENEQQIIQLASAGDNIKHHVRRAYVRLLIEEMHRQEIEINLNVV